MSKKTLIFSDPHFGIKQNSLIWFKYQCEFFNVILEYAYNIYKHGDKLDIVCCGDTFDLRGSINPMIAKNVQIIYKELSNYGNFYIICGNHDYYNKENAKIAIPEILFNFGKVIWDNIYEENDILYVPWYNWPIKKIKKTVKRIYTHADLINNPIITNCPIISGHMHKPYIKHPIYNIGAITQFTFADTECKHGFYIIDEETSTDNILNYQFIENQIGINFYKFNINDNFNINKIKCNDYLCIYIPVNEFNTNKVDEKLNIYKSITQNITLQLVNTNIEENNIILNTSDQLINIKDLAEQYCPTELKEQLNKILLQ